MKVKVILLPIAKEDIKRAAHWYNGQQKGLGKRFTSHVRQKIQFIANEPYATAIRYDAIRTAVMDVFPYMIHYYFEEKESRVIILAVLHTSRNPDIWKTRS